MEQHHCPHTLYSIRISVILNIPKQRLDQRQFWNSITFLFNRQLSAHVDIMNPNGLAAKFPWLNMSDLALGSYGNLHNLYMYISKYICNFLAGF